MKFGDNLTGSLLVAHPCLRDPNFRRTIVFLSQHCPKEGSTGFVLNRPLKSLKKRHTAAPLFFGGPVGTDESLLTSLQWRENPTLLAFRAFTEEGDAEACKGWEKGLRIFEGYSCWSAGQLEQEIESNTWIVIPPTRELIEMNDPAHAWHNFMRNSGPLLHLLSKAPDDPGMN